MTDKALLLSHQRAESERHYLIGLYEQLNSNTQAAYRISLGFLRFLIMAPQTHYAKSQEMVYKELGTASRPKFKLVHATRSPFKQSAKTGSGSDPAPPAPPPVVSAPTDGSHSGADNPPFSVDDHNIFLDEHTSSKKKKASLLISTTLPLCVSSTDHTLHRNSPTI